MNFDELYKEYGNKKLNIYSMEFMSPFDGCYSLFYTPTSLWFYTHFSYIPFETRYVSMLKGQVLLEKLDMKEVQKLWDSLPERIQSTIEKMHEEFIWIESIRKELVGLKSLAGDKEKFIQLLFLRFMSKNYKVIYSMLIKEFEKEKDSTLFRQEFLDKIKQKRLEILRSNKMTFRNPIIKAYAMKISPLEKLLWDAIIDEANKIEKISPEMDFVNGDEYIKIKEEAVIDKVDTISKILVGAEVLEDYDFLHYAHDVEILTHGTVSKIYEELSKIYAITGDRVFERVSEMFTNELMQGMRNVTKTINTSKILSMDGVKKSIVDNIRSLELEKKLKPIELHSLRKALDRNIKGALMDRLAFIMSENPKRLLYKELIENSDMDPSLVILSKIQSNMEYLYKDLIFFKKESDVSLSFMLNLNLQLLEIEMGKQVLDFEKELTKIEIAEHPIVEKDATGAEIVDQYNLISKIGKELVIQGEIGVLERVKVSEATIHDIMYLLEDKERVEPKEATVNSKMHTHVKDVYKNLFIHVTHDRYFKLPFRDGKIVSKYIQVEKYLKELVTMTVEYQFLRVFKDALIVDKEYELDYTRDRLEASIIEKWEFIDREDLVIDLIKFKEFADKEVRITDIEGSKYVLLDKGTKDALIDRLAHFAQKSEKDVSVIPIILGLMKDGKDFTKLLESFFVDRESKDFQLLWQEFSDRFIKDLDILKDVTSDSVVRDTQLSELFDYFSVMRDVNITTDPKLLERQMKELLVKFGFILNEMYSRWEFLPSDVGPWDDLLVPDEDWDYVANPVNGFTQDPLLGKDKGKKHVVISVHIIRNVIEFMKMILQTNLTGYAGSTPEVAVKHFITTLYDWLESNAEGTEIEGTIREDYWRLFRLIRWYAEGVIINVDFLDKNRAIGVKYVNRIITDVIDYYKQHHANFLLELDKVKGSRRRDISSKPKLLKRENHEYKKEEPPEIN